MSAERRCPKCNASVRECGFSAQAVQAFQARPDGFAPGAHVTPLYAKAGCLLCGAELPWTVGQLTGRAA